MYAVFYIIVFFSFLFVLYYYQNNLLASIIILVFYSGLAAYPGKFIENPYKILLLLLTLYAAIKFKPFTVFERRDKYVIFSFVLFSFSFFLAAYFNNTNPVLTLSQYGKYLVPFTLFFILKYIQKTNMVSFVKISLLLMLLLKIQIVLSFAKLLTVGVRETTVGSIAYIGGGIATLLPILGFIIIWMTREGRFVKKDWYFIVLLIFISFMSYKRAIWFMMPVVITFFLFYVPRKKLPSRLAWIIPCIPLIFYLGARLNPTLNKEGKVWGSFDIEFVVDYVEKYNFGDAAKSGKDKKLGDGRGGATLLFFDKIGTPSNWTKQDVFGYGLEEFVTKDYDEFDETKFGLNSKGAVTGIFNTYISFGFVGVLFFLTYTFLIISYIRIKRIRYVITGIFIWEYFFYIGTIFSVQALTVLFMYTILYLNYFTNIRVFFSKRQDLMFSKV